MKNLLLGIVKDFKVFFNVDDDADFDGNTGDKNNHLSSASSLPEASSPISLLASLKP